MEHINSFSNIPEYVFDIWQGIVNSVASLLHVPCVMITRLELPDMRILRSNTSPDNPFFSETTIPLLGKYFADIMHKQDNLVLDNIRNKPEWADSPVAQAGIIAYQGLPLRWPDGEFFGIILAIDTKEHAWDKTSETLMFTFKSAIEAHLTITNVMTELQQKNFELEQALSEVHHLQGLLPVCAYCRKIRDDKGYWSQIESYFAKHTELQFSHGICPDCYEKQMNDMKR